MESTFKVAVGWLLLDVTGKEGRALVDETSSRFPLDGSVEMEERLRQDYWLPMLCHKLSCGIDYYCFDLAYQLGLGSAVRILHQMDDKDYPYDVFLLQLDLLKRGNLKSRKLWFENKHRWTNRCNRVLKRSLKLLEEPIDARV